MYPYAVYCVMASNLGVAGHFIRRYRVLIPPIPCRLTTLTGTL